MGFKVEYSYYIDDIEIGKGASREDAVVEYVKLRRLNPEFTLEQMIEYFSKINCQEQYDREELKKIWNSNPEPYTFKEILKRFSNAEQRMLAFKLAGPERVLKGLESTVIDEEVVTKKQTMSNIKPEFKLPGLNKVNLSPGQKLTSDMFETNVVEYNDKYTLHKVDKENAGTNNDVYIVECECPTTKHKFFLFVDSKEPQCQTAIGAVAWTLRTDDGNPITRDEYLGITSES